MVVLGLILVALGIAVGAISYLAAAGQSQTVELTAVGWTRAFSVLELLVIGAVAVLLVWLGWAAMSASMRRRARLRREEREQERYAELERTHSDYVADTERRFEESRLRDEDLSRREEQIRNRQAEVDLREGEIVRRETARRDRERPAVADVVTGRATGSVSQGDAHWVEGDAATRPHPVPRADERATQDGVDETGAHEGRVDESRMDQTRADETRVDEDRVDAARTAETGRPEDRRSDRA